MPQGFTPRTKQKTRSPQPQTEERSPHPRKPWTPIPGQPTPRWLNQSRCLWIQLAYTDEHGVEQVKNRKVFMSVATAEKIAKRMAMDLGVSECPEHQREWTLEHVFIIDGTMPQELLPMPPKVALYGEYYNPLNWVPSDVGEGQLTELALHLPTGLGQEELAAIAQAIPANKKFRIS